MSSMAKIRHSSVRVLLENYYFTRVFIFDCPKHVMDMYKTGGHK